MRERLPAPPEEPRSFEALVRELEHDVLPYMSRCDHPGYFAFIPASGTFPAALGDFIASALNIYAGSWMEAAGPSRLELLVLEAFKQWIGYPEQRGRRPGERRLGGQHDRAGLRPRGADAPHAGWRAGWRPAGRGLRVRPGALLDRAGRAGARPAARPAARAAERQSSSDAARCAERRDRRRRPAWPGCRSSSPPPRDRRTRARSIPCPRSPRSAGRRVPGCTSMRPMAGSPR